MLAWADDSEWSMPVRALRARLQVQPSSKEESPFSLVFIEFENVENHIGQKRIRFSLDKLALRVSARRREVAA